MSIFSTIRHWFSEAPHFDGTIIATDRIGSRIRKVTICLPEKVFGPFPMGSFVIAYTWGCIPRAYSIAKTDARSFTLLVSFSGGGAGARFFRDATIGTKVVCYGPFDDFPYHYGTRRPKVFFATSTGVAPFCMMIEEALKEGLPATLYLGSPKESDISFKEEFEQLAATNSSFTFSPVLSSPEPTWKGAHGYVTDFITKNHEIMRESDIYICGIPPMTMGVLAALEKANVPTAQIFVQKFG